VSKRQLVNVYSTVPERVLGKVPMRVLEMVHWTVSTRALETVLATVSKRDLETVHVSTRVPADGTESMRVLEMAHAKVLPKTVL